MPPKEAWYYVCPISLFDWGLFEHYYPNYPVPTEFNADKIDYIILQRERVMTIKDVCQNENAPTYEISKDTFKWGRPMRKGDLFVITAYGILADRYVCLALPN